MRLLSFLLLALLGAFSLVLAADSSAENSTAAANPLAALPVCAVCHPLFFYFFPFLFDLGLRNNSKNVLRRLLQILPATQMTSSVPVKARRFKNHRQSASQAPARFGSL